MSDEYRRLLAIASLYEQTGRAVYDQRGPAGLQPAQWSSLRYFGRAGSEARTVTGLAKFLGVTLAPASRAAASLEKRGLIASRRNPMDARSSLFDLTTLGREHLQNDPLNRFAEALSKLPPDHVDVFQEVVIQLLSELKKGEVKELE